jgi:A/G-specific adenine glycosylase
MRDFAQQILSWYECNRRKLPWRGSRDPYRIWLSEVILQQTRVDQGRDYYVRFIEFFPTVYDLARASEQMVLNLWQGLGYYSRARNMHAAAHQILENYGGEFPDSYEELLKLKGVGEYTAAAIASIAFGEPVPVVDGNVKRLFSRMHGLEDTGGKLYNEVKEMMKGSIDPLRAGDFNQAVMEFGALQCVPKNPQCENCIFNTSCHAYRHGMVERLPAREARKAPRKRFFSYLVIRPDEDSVIMKKRNDKDIWENLYEFPLIESDRAMENKELLREPDLLKWFGAGTAIEKSSKTYKHQLSHQTIFARFHKVDLKSDKIKLHKGWERIMLKAIDSYPISRLMERYFEEED